MLATFLSLLGVTFAISLLISFLLVWMFAKPIRSILQRIIADEISTAWEKYLKFAIYVVGITSGVRIWDLQRYITPPATKDAQILELTRERWALEILATVLGSLQGVAWMLLVFFLFALVAFVIVRAFELKRQKA
jgi:sensor histidine kinase regulating citrate/malate metabolism